LPVQGKPNRLGCIAMPLISIRELSTATRFPSHCLIARKILPKGFLNFIDRPQIGWPTAAKLLPCFKHIQEHAMRKFHSIAALCGDGLRPELQALFERLDIDPSSELFVRADGMHQSGPDPASETAFTAVVPLTKGRG
jgi:hypothetical protein